MTSRRIPCGGGASSPISYAAATASTARAADSSSRACTSASTWPAATVCPRFALHTTPTEWSIASSFFAGHRPARVRRCRSAVRPHASRFRTRCTYLRHDRGSRKDVAVGIAALRADPALVCLARRPVRRRLLGSLSCFLEVHAEIGQGQEPRRGVEYELGEVRRAFREIVSTASLTSSALPTAAPSGWSMSVRRQTTSRAGAVSEIDHLLGEDARVVERLHERAVSDLDVEHDRVARPPRASWT